MILLTGASGFVGKYAVPALQLDYNLTTISLQNTDISIIDFTSIKTVVHLAGMAHQMDKADKGLYFNINHKLTLDFAMEAKKKGVAHFIYISSTKVYGEHIGKTYFNEKSDCVPTDAYGESKWKAEQDLFEIADEQFIVSVIRPPLIYGHNVKGNLNNLLTLIHKFPLVPFGKIQNKRSMVYVGNLTALISSVIKLKKGGVFLAGDSAPYSTSRLVNTMIEKANLNTKNISIPIFLRDILRFLKPDMYVRLFGDIIIDNTETNISLGFTPPFTFDEGVAEMVKK